MGVWRVRIPAGIRRAGRCMVEIIQGSAHNIFIFWQLHIICFKSKIRLKHYRLYCFDILFADRLFYMDGEFEKIVL